MVGETSGGATGNSVDELADVGNHVGPKEEIGRKGADGNAGT